MFILYANKTQVTVRKSEPVTSGSVNVCPVRFQFSEDWNGMARTAVFRAGVESRAVLLDGSGEVDIPWEVLQKPGVHLFCGVYGTQGGHTVLPTIWEDLGAIQEGVSLGEESQPPAPELWEQALARKGDGLAYDGLNLSLLSGDKPLSTVQIAGGGEGGGVSDHRALSNRDAAGQHPISSITGLEKALERIPEPAEALTNAELEEMLQ